MLLVHFPAWRPIDASLELAPSLSEGKATGWKPRATTNKGSKPMRRQLALDEPAFGVYSAGMSYPTPEQREFLYECGLPADRPIDVMHRLQQDLDRVRNDLNLTRITGPEEFWTLHVCDSLSVGRVCGELLTGEVTVADVGCGGGFPVFPLAWANPELHITAVESRYRKAEFLRAEADRLDLSAVDVVHKQAREAGQKPPHRHAYDRVLLRAVGTAGKMVRQVRGLIKPEPGSAIVFYKTPESIENEHPLAVREADKYGFEVETPSPFSLPANAGQRQFLILRKSV